MACIKTEEPQWEAGSAPNGTQNKPGQKNIIQIYTDWANHYLDKGKCKRHIQNLQNDVVDGVIISDVIEAVTGQKVADVNRKPRTRAQMLQNLDLCLAHLRLLGVAVDDIQGDDVIDGKLKPILGLFFQLSRHKQQQQQQQKRRPRTDVAAPANHASTKVPTTGKSGVSCIPSARERQAGDNRTKQSLLQKPASAASSRSGSPTSVSGSRQRLAGQRSGISTPRMARAATAKAASAQAGSAIKTPQTKPSNIGSPATNTRERNKAKSGGSNVIKRTSSSSGFSSARSERSDSSSNVNTNESLSPGEPSATPAPVRTIPEGYGSLSRRGQRSMLQAPGQRSRPGIVPPAAAAAKRRSLAGSQSSLASSCSSAAPSSIPKPPSASAGAHQSSSSSSVPTTSSSSSPRSSASVTAPAPPAATSIPTPAAAAAPPATPAPPTSAPALRRPSESEDSRSGAEEKAALVQLPKQRQLGRGRVNPGGVSVALVSPMPHTPEMGRASSKTRTASGDRSRPKEVVSDPPPEQKPPSPPDKPPPDGDGEADQEDVYSLRPMQPILRLSQYGYSRGGSLAQRRQQAQQHNYGYMSDTDAVADQNHYDTVLDGYMSEDGLYARSPPQVKYSSLPLASHRARTSGGEETALWRIETQQRGIPTPAMSDRAAYYSYTDAPGATFMKRIGHSGEQTRIGKKDGAPEFKQISNTQWKRAVEGRRPPGDLTSGGVPSPGIPDQRRERERSATPVNKHKRENGTNTPDPAMSSPSAAAAESPNLKFSRSKLRKSAASYAKSTSSTRPTSQTSVSSAGSSGLPPKDPEHRPRTKVKVSGSTQTTSELLGGEQEHHAARRLQQLKSYSLTGPAAQQLSQSVRERILASGGAGNGSEHTFSTLPAVAGRERVPRPKPSDGSLSDSNYGTYADPRRHPAQRPSSAYTSYVGQQLAKTFRGSMTEAESMESVSSGASGLLQQLQQQQQQQQRSGSLTHNRLINYQWEGQAQSPRLSRSNSIRSTKSEKLYSNMLQRGGSGEEEPFYGGGVPPSGRAGEPPSPTPSPSRASFPLSPSTARSSYGARSSRDDDAHGSSLSLVSTTSSLYSAHEEKQATEARRLKRELLESQEKVQTLTNQLTTNAHVVEAFEQSLTSMTKKLHQVTLNSEQKERELGDLRRQMDRLQRAIAAGSGSTPQGGGAPLTRQTSNESISSLSSACSAHSQQSSRTPDSPGSKKKKKKGWFSASPQLRSSFGKAFSRRKPKAAAGGSDMEDGSAPSSPVMPSRHSGPPSDEPAPESAAGGVEADLRRQLREKDTALTDMRLEALSTHHQLETLKETVGRMRREMACVRQDNERLQRLVASRSAGSSRSSLAADGERPPAVPSPTSETAASRLEEARKDEKLLTASVWLDGAAGDEGAECLIGTVTVGRKTIWESLDDAIKRTFKDYLCRLDPDQSLGIDADAITGYTLGEVTRPLSGGADVPELMPWGYTVGDVKQTRLSLRGTEAGCVDAFVFETLIPKPMVHRYVSILVEHRRVILCGQSGTGKTFLARRLADYLVRRSGMAAGPDSVATVTVEPGGGRELHQYLAQLSERCRQPDAALPHVLILDQLHHVQALDDVFNGFLSTAHTDPRCPYIIGTMSQPAGGTTSLQLHHNFRWVLCANHVEPVRGFLGRHLRRRLSSAELASGSHDPQLRAVFEWVPRVWQQLNKFLETHSSADVTMGPRLLLNCPTDLTASQVWFTGVWNYSIVPYLVETVREGLLIYGRRASWHDPTQFVVDTYPWPRAAPHAGVASLTRLRPEDVGYESASTNYKDAPASAAAAAEKRSYSKDSDPLLSMLMSLQEAANYNSAVPVSARSSSAAASPDRADPGRPGRGVPASGQATL